jgi:hypothetical protein
MNNPYVRYYLDQQQGRGMPVFRGSPWQVGYGLGGLFRSLARRAMPLIKTGAKALGNIALKMGQTLWAIFSPVETSKKRQKHEP